MDPIDLRHAPAARLVQSGVVGCGANLPARAQAPDQWARWRWSCAAGHRPCARGRPCRDGCDERMLGECARVLQASVKRQLLRDGSLGGVRWRRW